jgi:hypothetical protein
MKHLLSLSFFCILTFLNAQTLHKCVTHELIQQGEIYNPGFSQSIQAEFQKVKNKNSNRSHTVYRIPVVFHIVWNSTKPKENIPDSCIHRQIELLNHAFRATNVDRSNLRPIFGLEAKDAEIEFYLATKDPQGNSTTGITRKSTTKKFTTNLLTGAISIDMKSTAKGGQDPWDVTKYYNVWVVNMPIIFLGQEQVGILGFATPPSGLPNWPSEALEGVGADGAVIQYQFIGNNNPNFASLDSTFKIANSGKTLIHETGHYLGLRHIWADKGDPIFGSASCVDLNGNEDDDGIDDTPYCGSNSQATGCIDDKNTCEHESPDLPDMWENYMDYSDEKCQVIFTPDQTDFMQKVIEQKRLKLVSWDVQTNINDDDSEQIKIIYLAQSESIRINMSNESAVTIQIINHAGQSLFKQKVNSSQSEFEISCKNLPNGVYSILVQGDQKSYFKKFVKL